MKSCGGKYMSKPVHGIANLMKSCPKCSKIAWEMPQILETFGRDRSRADRLAVYCKECRNKRRRREYREKMSTPD